MSPLDAPASSVAHRDPSGTFTVRVPMAFRQRGGRKLVIVPDGVEPYAPAVPRLDSALVKAIVRAHRWRRMMESGAYANVGELAAAEAINPSYLSRVLRLTLLAPDIVEAVLDGRQAESVTLERMMKPFSQLWAVQASSI